MKKIVSACVFAFLCTSAAFAADVSWTGTWKLDPARSHFTGETFTYSNTTGKAIHYSDGSNVSYDFALDGKEYPVDEGRTTAWTSTGDRAWDSVSRTNGQLVGKTHRTLSPDDKTLTVVSQSFQPDGQSTSEESVWIRVTGKEGLTGTWKSTKVEITAPDVYRVTVKEGGIMRWEIPAYGAVAEGIADGRDIVVTGPQLPPALSMSYKLTSPVTIDYVEKINGKAMNAGTMTLSADGKSYTDVGGNPGKPAEKTTGFYVKQ